MLYLVPWQQANDFLNRKRGGNLPVGVKQLKVDVIKDWRIVLLLARDGGIRANPEITPIIAQ